jgi:hypothetical protein
MDRALSRVMRLLEQLFDRGEFEELLEVARPRRRRPSSRGRPRTTARTAPDIEWRASPPPEAPPAIRAALAGTCDPVDGQALQPGERVAVCRRCGAGYRATSWAFLERENDSRCVVCRAHSTTFECLVPAADGRTPPAGRSGETAVGADASTHIVACPACGASNRVPASAATLCRCARCSTSLAEGRHDGAAPIAVPRSEVPNQVGRVVEFQGRVARTQPGLAGGRVLVFEAGAESRPVRVSLDRQVCEQLQQRGVRLRSYGARTVRVRGLVRKHPRWGTVVVPTDGQALRVFD